MIEAIFGLVGVVIGSAITVGREVWVNRSERRRAASYAAIRLVSILEEYALACVDVVQDDGTAYGRPAGRTEHGEEYFEVQVSAPSPPIYPDDIDWKSLDEGIMHRVLSLPNTARSVDRTIYIAGDYASPPDYEPIFVARHQGYAYLGLEAFAVASELRKEFRVPKRTSPLLNEDWNPIAYLRERQTILEGKAS